MTPSARNSGSRHRFGMGALGGTALQVEVQIDRVIDSRIAGGTLYAVVRYRLDERKAREEPWTADSALNTIYPDLGRDDAKLVRNMTVASRLWLEIRSPVRAHKSMPSASVR
jgi:hypothetical protein